MSTVGSVKKKLIVVKSLRDLSPKKQLLISRKPFENEDANELEHSQLGNTSPTVMHTIKKYI